jgi:hypothetical protein
VKAAKKAAGKQARNFDDDMLPPEAEPGDFIPFTSARGVNYLRAGQLDADGDGVWEGDDLWQREDDGYIYAGKLLSNGKVDSRPEVLAQEPKLQFTAGESDAEEDVDDHDVPLGKVLTRGKVRYIVFLCIMLILFTLIRWSPSTVRHRCSNCIYK